MSQDRIYVRELENLSSLPQDIQDEIARQESLGYNRRHLVVSNGKVHYYPELDQDDSLHEAFESSSN